MILTVLRLNYYLFKKYKLNCGKLKKKNLKTLKIVLKLTKKSLFFPFFRKKSFLNQTLGLGKSFLNQTTYVLKNLLSQQSFLNRERIV